MPLPPPRVDAIVPVYGGWEHVEPCVRALVAQTVPVRVIIVDDCGPDDTADRIATAFPDLTLIRNEVNRGFAATCNRGLPRAVPRWLFSSTVTLSRSPR
ncbi:glycosyltransferase family 2 protein [Microbacterium amylolyticum]|uniref:glycosyltransferase family 2 protein n=1 Tax=Microbacterium amylolyticum TaxID=936337 RepID=UPI0036103C96